MYISTTYTVLGYETELTDGDKRTEIARGGNHRMCSESRLLPSYGPGDINDSRMTITEVKAMALLAHREALQEHPDALDAGCAKDKDGQDEELAMLGISNGMSSKFKARYKKSLLLETTRLRKKHWAELVRWGSFDLTAPYI